MENQIIVNIIYLLLQVIISSSLFGDSQDCFGGVSPSYYENNNNKFYTTLSK